MTETGHDHQAAWAERISALAQDDPGFALFVRKAVASTDESDLALYPPEALEGVFAQSYGLLGRRDVGQHKIVSHQPSDDTFAKVTVIDITSQDMPFIVDSVLAAIRAAGGSIVFMAHPILAMDRSTTPWTLKPEPGADTRQESLLHIHIAQPPTAAGLAAIRSEIDAAMHAVRRTVAGWRPMLERLRQLVVETRANPPALPDSVVSEALHFLAWLADHNFTFLGMREYRLAGEGAERRLEPVPGSGLGVLDDPAYLYLRQGADYVEMTDQHLDFLASDELLLVTKANKRAIVHRRVHMDYIGVKIHGADGVVVGELRILGLFTSKALATPHRDVPLIRRKLEAVLAASGTDPRGHTGKALLNALDNYPRDELFQISQDLLGEFAAVVAALADRPRVRVLPRIDRFDNFVSVLFYVPRDRYDASVRERVGDYLAERYDGRVSAYTPDFAEGELARVHYIIGRTGGPTPTPARAELEADIAQLCRAFADRILSAARDRQAVGDYLDAFSADYQTVNSHRDALTDIAIFRRLVDDGGLAVHLAAGRDGPDTLTLKVYHRRSAIPLSDRVPMLENFGFRVIDERTYLIRPTDGVERYLHDMTLVAADGATLAVDSIARRFEAALLAIWSGAVENDGYNQLTVRSILGHEDVAILRALGHYLKQVGIAYSRRYLEAVLNSQAELAVILVRLFHTLHDPDFPGDREAEAEALRETLASGLDAITSIDEDTIVRRFLNLVEASLRTNFYQRDEDGARRPALAVKFDTALIEAMPEPVMYREIFVYAPRVEGVHMRGSAIARGGLRWSDRPEDFRTEILGLVKAQMVKNAVIVPGGAKGGFVPRLMPANADREAQMREGTACYEIFIGALLDVTDNLVADEIAPPAQLNRRDGDDPYLVVAADKGTARFSDTANAISTARDFWLGDAFASGGSAGYDHKAMGITARGGWEAVKRHFREMDIDIQTQTFTVAGVGDMSGDVFGNAMLLSEKIRLVAAFDHRDIFLDPDPDPATSFAERRRLFALPRSSWQDYDKGLISPGGGVFSRRLKSIPLTPRVQELLDLPQASAAPDAVLRAILAARVDLMWFGGIGTYVRAGAETDAEAGDRANDAIRITGRMLRARVVGEGANLGLTQLGRIEYARAGGRVNTDAIDNSAGVNSSDLEVNIKIALAPLVRSDALALEDRNRFLEEMTDAVAGLCLRNNYLQSLALSLAERSGADALHDYGTLMAGLEARGALDRGLEYLPDDGVLAERMAAGEGLTRPELAVLLAYAKTALFDDLLATAVPDDPYLARELYRYFPAQLQERYPDQIEGHRLRREVIATVLSNAMINRGGPAFVSALAAGTSSDAGAVAFAYAAARDSYDLPALNAAVDALDAKVAGATQLALYAEIGKLQVDQALWFLRHGDFSHGLSAVVERYRAGVVEVRAALPDLLTPFMAQSTAEQEKGFEAGGTPPDLAHRVANLSVLTLASDIVLIAQKCEASVADAALAYFSVLSRFRLGRVTEQGDGVQVSDRFDRMALDRARANLMRALRDLTGDILSAGSGSVEERIAAWRDPRKDAIDRTAHTVSDLTEGELTVSRLSVAAGLLSDLARS